MLTVDSLLDFLLNLLRDEAAQAEFERDPEGALAR
ncbi:MAG: IniB N-terminal domain-containing protein, partial [Pseudonocardiaceae bacterium]